jgi:hypothetical protein
MSISQLSFLAVRLYSFVLVFAAIGQAEQALFLPSMGTPDSRFFAVACGVNAALYLLVAAFFIGRTRTIARFLVPTGQVELELGSPDPFWVLGFSLVGLVFAVKGGADFLAISTDWVSRHYSGAGGPYSGYSFSLPGAVAAGAKTLLGLWLFLGAQKVLALIRRLETGTSPASGEGPDADA